VRGAAVVVPCAALAETLAFFTDELAFRVEVIFPADDPAVAEIAGYGVRLRLERAAADPEPAPVLRLACADLAPGEESVVVAPNGLRVERVPADPPLELPPLEEAFVHTRLADDSAFGAGRAGMLYRDLVPGRLGGRFVASHIRIPGGGAVPDYVHHHAVHFQTIYCLRGWVRVVYQDQGPPFVLQAGDCVLQPPGIRHRVLESSPGLEVVELGSPAEHATRVDHALELPTGELRPERDFGGQRFVRHVAADAAWSAWRLAGFEARDTGIAAATDGLATVRVARVSRAPARVPARAGTSHDAELCFLFVTDGTATLEVEGRSSRPLASGDALVVPAGVPHAFRDPSADFELLEVALPADFTTRPA